LTGLAEFNSTNNQLGQPGQIGQFLIGVEKISHYCQKCRAANEPGEVNCWRCGTTLMLVVYPPSVQHEDMIVPSYYEDHLLERVSLLELRLSQLTEKMSLALDLMLKQAKTIQGDHALLKSILEILDSYGITESEKLSSGERQKPEKIERAENGRNKKIEEIINRHSSPNAELFVHLVREGARLLEQTEEKQAFQMLERAALLSPENVPLLLFVGENLFRAEKFLEARKHLEKAYKIESHNAKVILLLGALYADAAEAEKSRPLLSVLANDEQTAPLVNYIWGMLAAFEENWNEALAAFKTALGSGGAPELQYLIGCCYFQLQMPDKARPFLRAATEADADFADAWFISGLAEPDAALAENAMKKAQNARDAAAQCLEFLKGKKPFASGLLLPFAHFKKENPRLLTKGSLRLVKFFKSRLFQTLY
jgi:tetratricopeptide (TPR) repeat protein